MTPKGWDIDDVSEQTAKRDSHYLADCYIQTDNYKSGILMTRIPGLVVFSFSSVFFLLIFRVFSTVLIFLCCKIDSLDFYFGPVDSFVPSVDIVMQWCVCDAT
jgi:hypothetical protein